MDRKGTQNVKILTENYTKEVMSYAHAWANVTGSTYAYKRQHERLQGIILHLERQQDTHCTLSYPYFAGITRFCCNFVHHNNI